MYKRLDKYIEKMQNVKLPVHKKSDPIMWIRGRNDGKNGYIGIVNGRLTSDNIRRELIMHKRYISNMKQLMEDSIEAVRYEIIRCEFELRCLKKRLHKAQHEYYKLRQLSNPSPHHINLLREKIALLRNYKEVTENRLLDIQAELRTAEETADKLIAQSTEILEKKLYTYLSGAKRFLGKEVLDHHIYDDLFFDAFFEIFHNLCLKNIPDCQIWYRKFISLCINPFTLC